MVVAGDRWARTGLGQVDGRQVWERPPRHRSRRRRPRPAGEAAARWVAEGRGRMRRGRQPTSNTRPSCGTHRWRSPRLRSPPPPVRSRATNRSRCWASGPIRRWRVELVLGPIWSIAGQESPDGIGQSDGSCQRARSRSWPRSTVRGRACGLRPMPARSQDLRHPVSPGPRRPSTAPVGRVRSGVAAARRRRGLVLGGRRSTARCSAVPPAYRSLVHRGRGSSSVTVASWSTSAGP